MAASPRYKIYNPSGEYVAACKYLEDSAAMVSFLGSGAQVKDGHSKVIWTEGSEEILAGESYDVAASTMSERVR